MKEEKKQQLQMMNVSSRFCLALPMRLGRSLYKKSRLLRAGIRIKTKTRTRARTRIGIRAGTSKLMAPRPLPSPLFLRCSCTGDAKPLRWTHKVGVAGMGDWIGLDGGAKVALPAACKCRV